MNTVEQKKGSSPFRPAQMRVEEAAIALLIERIASLDSDVKDDLVKVFMDVQSCTTPEEQEEIEQTVRELIFPQVYGDLIVGNAGNANGAAKLGKWSERIGECIKRLRKEKNWSQEQLAEASGLPQPHISKLENGQHSPSHKTVVALANALGVKTSELDPGEDDTA